MGSINGVSELPVDLQQLLVMYGGQMPGSSKVERAVTNAMKLIAESNALSVGTAPQGLPTVNVLVLNGKGGRADDAQFYLSDVPKLKGVGKLVRKSMVFNLEKLLLEKQLETNENVSMYTRNRIDAEKTTLERRHKEMRQKIEENIRAMEDAARNNLIMKIFGWVMVAAMVALAVFTAGTSLYAAGAMTAAMTTTATVGAAGAAAGTAAATTAVTATAVISTTKVVMLCISAALALANQIMEETGVTEQMIKNLTAQLYGEFKSFFPENAVDLVEKLVMGRGFRSLLFRGGWLFSRGFVRLRLQPVELGIMLATIGFKFFLTLAFLLCRRLCLLGFKKILQPLDFKFLRSRLLGLR